MRGWLVACAFVQLVMLGDAGAVDPTRHASQLVHRHYAARDGLPHNLANSLAQTPDGYLWIGSEEGVTRFDGRRFVTFTRADGLPSNDISALAVQGDALWLGTREHGLVLRDHGALVPFSDTTLEAEIRVLAVSPSGELWVGTRNGGVAHLRDGRVVEHLTRREGLPSDDIRALAFDADGAMWVGTFAGAAIVRGGRVSIVDELADLTVYSIALDREHAIWLGTSNGLARTRGAAIELMPGDAVLSVACDRDGNVWIGHPLGLARRTHDGVVENVPGFTTRILALFEDRDGNMWIGTQEGLDRLSDGEVIAMGAAESFTDAGLYGLLEASDHTIWAAATTGLYRMPPNGVATNVAPERGAMYSIYEAPNGDIWAGGRDGSLGRWHDGAFAWLGKGTWEEIRSIEPAPGGIWLGTLHGLYRMRGDDFAGIATIVRTRIVSAIAAAHDGTLWVGTQDDGLLHVREDGTPIDDIPTGGPPEHDAISMIDLDPDGSMWVGTEGDRLWRLANGRWGSVGTREGLFDDLVWRILDDGRGWMWMSSNRGIWRVARDQLVGAMTGTIRRVDSIVYSEADGLRVTECDGATSPAGSRAHDGRLWFPTTLGAAVIDPRYVRAHDAPTAIVEGVRVDGRDAPLSAVTLASGASRLEMSYTAPSLRTSAGIRFRYRLEPFEDAWNDALDERIAEYTNLPPGTYELVVQAGNASGWGHSASLAVVVLPRFYQTLWFRALAVLAVLAAVLAIPLLRVRQLRAREVDLAARVQEALRDVKTLAGLVPICAWCKQIRDDRGYWNKLEAYLTKHTDAKFTHGICPGCVKKMKDEDDDPDDHHDHIHEHGDRSIHDP